MNVSIYRLYSLVVIGLWLWLTDYFSNGMENSEHLYNCSMSFSHTIVNA